jgi:hypothetical protein
MIVYKSWKIYTHSGLCSIKCEGWFLFGVIPLYIKKHY